MIRDELTKFIKFPTIVLDFFRICVGLDGFLGFLGFLQLPLHVVLLEFKYRTKYTSINVNLAGYSKKYSSLVM